MKQPWLSFASILLGFWLFAAPATFNYEQSLITSDLIVGLLLILFGAWNHSRNSPWIACCYIPIGLWLEFAPLLFWTHNPASYLNDTIVGMLVLALFLRMPYARHQEPPGSSIPPGWSYNPSSWPQRLPIALFAFIGWMVSRYLSSYQLGFIPTVWDPFFQSGTLQVITSNVSHAFPISDAGLGALAYSLEMISTFKGGENRWHTMPWMVLIFGVLAVPLSLTSVILVILQPLAVGAWCTLCLVTAFLMLILIALSIDEIIATIQYLRYSKEKSFWRLLFEGGRCPDSKEDHRTPALDKPLTELIQAGFWGVTLPWNLILTILLGAFIMASPGIFGRTGLLADCNHVFGAFIVVTSMVSLSEAARKVRILNFVFATIVFVGTVYAEPYSVHNIISCFLVGLFSYRRGPLRESFHWEGSH